MFEDPGGLILNHVREHEVFPDRAARLDRAAGSLGYRREVVRHHPGFERPADVRNPAIR